MAVASTYSWIQVLCANPNPSVCASSTRPTSRPVTRSARLRQFRPFPHTLDHITEILRQWHSATFRDLALHNSTSFAPNSLFPSLHLLALHDAHPSELQFIPPSAAAFYACAIVILSHGCRYSRSSYCPKHPLPLQDFQFAYNSPFPLPLQSLDLRKQSVSNTSTTISQTQVNGWQLCSTIGTAARHDDRPVPVSRSAIYSYTSLFHTDLWCSCYERDVHVKPTKSFYPLKIPNGCVRPAALVLLLLS